MLIAGAGACARDLLAMLLMEKQKEALTFYDDINKNAADFLYDKYRILKTPKALIQYFEKEDKRYALGIGKPKYRYELSNRFDALGGNLVSLISSQAHIGPYNQISQRGVIIMHETILTNEVSIEDGSLINMRCTLGHFCRIGRFCDLAPGVYISSSHVGDYCQIGINAVIKPGVNLGKHVTVGAGSVVTKDIPDHQIVAGVPAICIGENIPFDE